MSRWVLIGLLVMTVLVIGINDAHATNKILGITIKHGSLVVLVDLSGVSGTKLATVRVDATIGFLCQGPQGQLVNPGEPEFQDVTLTQTQIVNQFDSNGKATAMFTFQLVGDCHQLQYDVVGNSEMVVQVVATTDYESCTGNENKAGPDGIFDGDPCFEFNGTVKTTKVIESSQTTCDDTYEFPVPVGEELENCESIVIAHQGGGNL